MNDNELLRGALVGLEDTLIGSGQQTAPTTATDILASSPAITAGLWELDLLVSLSGTAETLLRNLNVRLGTTVIYANVATVQGAQRYRFRFRITNAMISAAGGSGSPAFAGLNARTAAAPTAGAVYTLMALLTKIGG